MDNRASQLKKPGPTLGTSQVQEQVRQYQVIINMITQMLAMDSLDEQLSLVLDTITAGLGYESAAVAFADENHVSLDIRKAVGFRDNAAANAVRIPLDSGLRHLESIHKGRPARISRGLDELEDGLLDQISANGDLLAFPLFGGPLLTETEPSAPGHAEFPRDLGLRGLDSPKTRTPPATSYAVLYVGTSPEKMDETSAQLLERLSDSVGVVIAVSTGLGRMERSIAHLRRERQWVESIMKSVADPIVLTNLDNEILLQNRRAEELFSGSDDASEGKRRALKMNDLLFSAYLSSATVSSANAVGRDLTLVDPIEGSDLHFEVLSTPALNELGEVIGLVSVFRDVTDLRLANEELIRNFNKLQQAEADARRESDRLNLIIENVGHPVVVTDISGNFILFNRRAESLFRQEAVTKSARDFLEAADDSSTRVLAAVRANSVKLTSFISGVASETSAGRQAEIDLTDPQTGRLLPMEITSVEVVDSTGQVSAVVSVLHDLSEVRELERRRLEQRLSESDKLAAVGTLAASIAHEVNNPLESIKNSLFLMQDSDDSESRARFLKIALKETERVSQIIRQMLGFARRGGGIEWVAINQLLDETLTLVENKLQHSGIKVIRSFDPGLPKIHAYPDQLRQVFLNLLLNAEQSIDRLGRIKVATSQPDAAQPSVSIEIADSGRGIEGDDLERIFEPFFTTRRDGTGLGLWVAQNIVRQHGGRIDVRSGPGKGTAFQIVLPVDSLPLRTENVR